MAPTTLVLGAGASHHAGFPVGIQLRNQIINLPNEGPSYVESVLGYKIFFVQKFVDEFAQSGQYSIDAFLARRDEYRDVGRAAIAYLILKAEGGANFTSTNEDHWYQYLVNRLTADTDWDSFDPSWLSIVTFNYDRSLESYLCRALQATYGKSEQEVVERLQPLKIVHVYGTVGAPFGYGVATDHVPFGPPREQLVGWVTPASKRIQVIPEGRDDAPTLEQAQAMLTSAQRVCFLGFGFDAINMRRLGLPRVMEGKGRIVATSLGLTEAQRARIARVICGPNFVDPIRIMLSHKCLSVLHETLILE